MEVDTVAVDLLHSLGHTYVPRVARQTDMYRHLEVVLLLADEGVVRHGKIKSFVRVHSVLRRGAVGENIVIIL